MKDGLIIVFTGNGKGKTTAAIGCAVRAAGRGLKSLVIQFMKREDSSGEQLLLSSRIGEIEIFAFGGPFFFPGDDPFPHRANAENAWGFMETRLGEHSYDLLVLDELAVVLSMDLLPLERVLQFLDRKEPSLHVIITGRNAPRGLIERAHVVTEMREVKHAYALGWPAVEGIDF
jgi:cob(I)alamin adenosyltransferase